MSLNRAQIRLKIRELIEDFYDIDTVGSGGISSSSETLPVTTLSRFRVGDKITIESEHMIVRAISSDTDTDVTVSRAFQLSTAAAHSAAVQIIIRPEFTDRAINQAINSAIADTYPDIWLEIIDEDDLETSTTAREYSYPSGFTFIRRIQIADSDGFFKENRDWEIIGTKIKFSRPFTDAGRAIRVIGQYYQTLLSDDSTNLEISDEQAEFIIYKGALLLLEMRIGPRLKATEYSASVNDRAGQPSDMLQMYRYLRLTAEQIKDRERKPHMSGYMMRPVR